MAKIVRASLRRLRQPLIRPYRLSYRTFEEFEPFLIELEDETGRHGFSDGHISPGSSTETREGGWSFLVEQLRGAIGREARQVQAAALARFETSKVAATTIATAVDVLAGHRALEITAAVRLPLLTPINALQPADIAPEVETWLGQGFRTFKIKVGKDVAADLARVAAIQAAVAGRAKLRLDANRAFSREDGVAFARGLDPSGIELLEQPCDSDDWEANAAVAAVSPVPLMLDEPICTLADIERAATIEGVGYCKLKLKRFGSIDRLIEGLKLVRTCGLSPVLGDGLGSEIHNWLEACAARGLIDNAGEFNGFLKPRERIMVPPLHFEAGAIQLPASYRPQPDRAAVERFTVETAHFS
jgi:L-alanine-DL-glutamate epimerase-like enolase superfamily enzyme